MELYHCIAHFIRLFASFQMNSRYKDKISEYSLFNNRNFASNFDKNPETLVFLLKPEKNPQKKL